MKNKYIPLFTLVLLFAASSFSQRLGNGGNLEIQQWQRLLSTLRAEISAGLYSEAKIKKENLQAILNDMHLQADISEIAFPSIAGKMLFLPSDINGARCIVMSSELGLKILKRGTFSSNFDEITFHENISAQEKAALRNDLKAAKEQGLIPSTWNSHCLL